MMMRILLVNTTYNVGSTGKLSRNFLEYVHSLGHEGYCIYADGKLESTIKGIRIKNAITRKLTIFFERLTGLLGFFSFFATLRACNYIKNIKPDIIYLGNLHGYYINFYKLYAFVKKHNIPCVQIMWDEFPMTGSCTFAFDCNKYETRCDKCPLLKEYPSSWIFDNSYHMFIRKKHAYEYERLAFVSVPFTISEAKHSFLLSDKKLFPIDEAIDQDKLFYPRDASCLRNKLGIPIENLVVLTVAVYPSERKGCKYFLELARKLESREDISFVHVGFLADKSDCPRNYIPIGFVKDQDLLAQYYSMADLFVCTSFAETQPNTCLEALSCGTRICGFNVSGIPTCAAFPYGEYVEPRDVDGLVKVVEDCVKKNNKSILDTRKYAESRFSSKDYNKKLFQVGLKLID